MKKKQLDKNNVINVVIIKTREITFEFLLVFSKNLYKYKFIYNMKKTKEIKLFHLSKKILQLSKLSENR